MSDQAHKNAHRAALRQVPGYRWKQAAAILLMVSSLVLVTLGLVTTARYLGMVGILVSSIGMVTSTWLLRQAGRYAATTDRADPTASCHEAPDSTDGGGRDDRG